MPKRIFFLLVLLYSCSQSQQETPIPCYAERQLSFFNPHEMDGFHSQGASYIYQTWIRQPNNMLMVHETLKKVGYHQLISEEQLQADVTLFWGYVAKPLSTLIDSLVLTYPLDSISSTYYREFWNRRKQEQNEETVFHILAEVDKILNHHEPQAVDPLWVNDTLSQLMQIKYTQRDFEQSQKDFEYLCSIGMYQSAYNYVFENYNTQSYDFQKEELLEQLSPHRSSTCYTPWMIDNTK